MISDFDVGHAFWWNCSPIGSRSRGGQSGERRSLAIALAVHFGARVIILDEPTAALGVKQATHRLRIVNEAKRRGLAVTHQ